MALALLGQHSVKELVDLLLLGNSRIRDMSANLQLVYPSSWGNPATVRGGRGAGGMGARANPGFAAWPGGGPGGTEGLRCMPQTYFQS